MKASELRIGNLIYNCIEGMPMQEIEASVEIIQIISNRKDSNKAFKPIPLTEEWLKRFGFEMDETFTAIYKRDYLLFEFRGNAIRLCQEVEDDGTAFNGISFWFKYVYQLQNLYFALTGEELTLKK